MTSKQQQQPQNGGKRRAIGVEGEEGTAGGVNDMVKSCQLKTWEFLIELKQPSPAISATSRPMHSRKNCQVTLILF